VTGLLYIYRYEVVHSDKTAICADTSGGLRILSLFFLNSRFAVQKNAAQGEDNFLSLMFQDFRNGGPPL
jgi:hypothetical protein